MPLYIMYRGWWIGVGSTDIKRITASPKLAYFNNPPQIQERKSRLTREMKLAVRVLEGGKDELIDESKTGGGEERIRMRYKTKGKYDKHSNTGVVEKDKEVKLVRIEYISFTHIVE